MSWIARAAVMVAAALSVAVFGVPVAGAQQSIPNGPWIQPEQELRLEALTSNEGLGKVLQQIESRSRGRLEVEVVGRSATGEWPIYLAKLGEPSADKQAVFIQGQIHGDEPLGSEAAVQLIQELALSRSPQVEQILAETTVWIIPRLNMDGAAFAVDGEIVQRRQNTQEWTPAEWGLAASTPAPWYHRPPTATRPGGYDINRDFTPDLDFRLGPGDEALLPGRSDLPGFFVTPEARASADVFKRLRPDVFIDLHHRGTNTQSEEDNQMTTLQVIGDVTEGTAEFPLDPDARARSFQLNAFVYDTLRAMGNSPFTGITRYPDVELPGTALGSYNLNGAAIMLYETRSAGQKSNGMLTRQIIVGLRATLVGLVDGSIAQVDPAHYLDIPPAGPRIGNPRF
jgi:hypothetical protein